MDYQGLVIRDDRNKPAGLRVERTTVTRGGSLTMDMSSGGGFIGRFTRK